MKAARLVLAATIGLVGQVSFAASCEDLAKLRLPATTITSAQVVAAGAFKPPAESRAAARVSPRVYAGLPPFCRVMASATPTSDSDIRIEVWMPVSGWNGKYQAVGNGGWAGEIYYQDMAAALAAGYATSGTDTGHVGNSAEFALGHPEKLVDFAHRAIHEMAVKSKAVIQAHYGAAAKRSYFNGCSQGGRQGLTNAQRYPDDFNGIVAGAASWNYLRSHAARTAINLMVNRTPDSHIPANKLPMVHNAMLEMCDALDGVKDGIIENPTRCKFDPAMLQCKGADNPSCLTPAQVESAKALTSPLKHPTTGAILFANHLWPGAELGWATLGGPKPLVNALTAMQNIVFKDRNWDWRTMNVATDVDLTDKIDQGLLASNNFDLKPFFDRGGKLLMWHGWADPQVSPQNSITYFQNVLKTVGPAGANSVELFMLPGVYHCRGGPGPDTFDRMSAIEQWVEHGKKPTRLVASGLKEGKTERTRPLCPYGQVAQYRGSGSTDEAASFTCTPQAMDVTVR